VNSFSGFPKNRFPSFPLRRLGISFSNLMSGCPWLWGGPEGDLLRYELGEIVVTATEVEQSLCGAPFATDVTDVLRPRRTMGSISRVPLNTGFPRIGCRYIRLLSISAIVVLIACSSVSAADGTISGVVRSEDGGPLPGVVVELSYMGIRDTTDSGGEFRFPPVPPGRYQLIATGGELLFGNNVKYVELLPGQDLRVTMVLREVAYTLDEMVIVSERTTSPGKLTEGPSFVSVIPRDAFEGRALTVAEILSRTPSAHVRSLGGLGAYSEISLRGSYSNQVQVYLDGMFLNDASGGGVNLSTIPLSNVEHVEVWRGGAPPEFGGNAVGGVVNIRTADFDGPSWLMNVGYGSFSTFQASLLYRGTVRSCRAMLSADYAVSKNDFKFYSDNGTAFNKDDDYWAKRKNNGFRSFGLLGKLQGVIGKSFLLGISNYFYSSLKDLPGRDINQRSKANLSTLRNLSEVKLSIFRPGLEMKPFLFHIYTSERYRDPEGSVGWGKQDNTYLTRRFGIRFPFKLNGSDRCKMGLTLSADRESFRPHHRFQKAVPLSCDRTHYSLGAGPDLLLWSKRIALRSNIQWDWYRSRYRGQASPFGEAPPHLVKHRLLSWHIGLRVSPVGWLSFRSNYGRYARVPSFYELFGDRGHTLSNSELKPERGRRYDAGVKIQLNDEGSRFNLAFEVDVFRTDFRDLIQWYVNDAGFISPDNVAKSYVEGVETVLDALLFGLVRVSGNLTIQDSRVVWEERKYYRNKRLPDRPRLYGSSKVEILGRRVRAFWETEDKSDYYLDRVNQRPYPGRVLHNVGATLVLGGGRLRLTLMLNNVTDKHTFDRTGMPLPGRSCSATLSFGVKGRD